jgi:glycerophosphoryl diester phosphodiesterase
MRHPYFDVPHPIVMGHRGAAGEAPENTLASFARALADGATILESDVHATRDGVPVLIHDGEVARTTDGAGRVAELGFAELSRLDAGYRFTRDGASHPERGRGHRIPSLEEALRAFAGVRFNLEIKADSSALVASVLELLTREGRAERTLLAAADDATMARIREAVAVRRSAVAIGASAGEVLAFVRAALDARPPAAGPMALQIPPDFGGRPLVTPELVAHAHRHGVEVHVWTVNEPGEIRRLLALGVDGIMSDYPARVRDATVHAA